EGEVEVEVDEALESLARIGHRLGDFGAAGEKAAADVDEDLDEQGVLVREVPVDSGSADSDGCPEVFEPHAGEAAFGDQVRCGPQEIATTFGLREASSGRRGFGLGHEQELSRVIWTTRLIITNLDFS